MPSGTVNVKSNPSGEYTQTYTSSSGNQESGEVITNSGLFGQSATNKWSKTWGVSISGGSYSFSGTKGTTGSDGSNEARPENYTIRVWKRTA